MYNFISKEDRRRCEMTAEKNKGPKSKKLRARKKERTRQEILDKAEDHFSKKPFDEVIKIDRTLELQSEEFEIVSIDIWYQSGAVAQFFLGIPSIQDRQNILLVALHGAGSSQPR